mgnify:CR=1 FL=1
MADPVSWLVVEPGWSVVDRAGDDLGSVDQVLGDEGTDIFSGLSVSHGLMAKPRYVPAELVGSIREGVVQLELDRAGFEQLGEHDASRR